MRRSRIRLVLPSLLALLAAGCDSAVLEPEEVAAEYELESYNGSPLPAVTVTTATLSSYLVAETLRLQADRRGTYTRVHRVDWVDPARPDELSGGTFDLTYRLRGETIEVSYYCPPNALCTSGPHAFGRLEGDALVLEVLDGNVYRYRRR